MKILYFHVTHASTLGFDTVEKNTRPTQPSAPQKNTGTSQREDKFSMKNVVKFSNPLLIKSSGSA